MFERLRRVSAHTDPELGTFELLRMSYFGPYDYELKLPKGSSFGRIYMSPGASTYATIAGKKVCIYRDRIGYHIKYPVTVWKGSTWRA